MARTRIVRPAWEPSREGGVTRDTPLSEQPSESGAVPWVLAPGTSHVSRFRFWDARDWPVIRKYGPFAGKSQLHVVFRGPKGVGEGPEYWYFFDSPAAGQEIARKMGESPHPYGEVLYPLVIQTGVTYQRQSR